MADILGKRYGKGIEICASALMMPFYIGTLAAQMVALGYLLHLFAHIDTSTGIVVGSIFMLLYTMAGGMWGRLTHRFYSDDCIIDGPISVVAYSLASHV